LLALQHEADGAVHAVVAELDDDVAALQPKPFLTWLLLMLLPGWDGGLACCLADWVAGVLIWQQAWGVVTL